MHTKRRSRAYLVISKDLRAQQKAGAAVRAARGAVGELTKAETVSTSVPRWGAMVQGWKAEAAQWLAVAERENNSVFFDRVPVEDADLPEGRVVVAATDVSRAAWVRGEEG